MTRDVVETMVRHWLRDHAGNVYCAECLARALGHADTPVIRVTLETLARQPLYWGGTCLCGEPGLRFG